MLRKITSKQTMLFFFGQFLTPVEKIRDDLVSFPSNANQYKMYVKKRTSTQNFVERMARKCSFVPSLTCVILIGAGIYDQKVREHFLRLNT